MKQNLYQILGVPQNASQSVLDAAYTELLTKHKEHHDLGGQDTKNELVIIKLAYDHLSNVDKRAAYDVKLEAMPVKPRIVHPTPKVLSQHVTHMASTSDGVFVTKSGELSAEQYGTIAVFNAIDISFKDVMQIIGDGETEFKRAISFNQKVLQLHFIALHVAVMYVYAARLLAVQEDTLKEIYKGITSGFNTLLKDGGSSVDDALLDLLERAFRIYIISLDSELTERNAVAKDEYDGDFMNATGSTASAFVDAVARSYGNQLQLQENSIDEILLKYHAAAAGIALLNTLWGDKYFTYRNKVDQMNPSVPQPAGSASPKIIPGHTPLTTGNKIFLVIFGTWLLLGAMKMIFHY